MKQLLLELFVGLITASYFSVLTLLVSEGLVMGYVLLPISATLLGKILFNHTK